jgi:hypothetical protein
MNKKYLSYMALLLVGLLVFANAGYAREAATFESFYSTSVGWGTFTYVVIGTTVIIATGAAILSGGTAIPLVAPALLGGGSFVLELGTEIVIGYSIDIYHTEHNNRSFVEQSKGMANLPLPLNTEGSEPYKKVMEILQQIDKNKHLADPSNKTIIETALKTRGTAIDNEWSGTEWKKLQFQVLTALLLMSNQQYIEAKQAAHLSIRRAKEGGYKSTLPSFIYAVCILYDEDLNVTVATQYFREAIMGEANNPLIPILFAAYLDRIIYLFRNDKIDEADLKRVALIATNQSVSQHAPITLSSIMVRYFDLLDKTQKMIVDLSSSSNESIRNSPKTARKVEDALKSYNLLLADANLFLQYLQNQKLEDGQRQEVTRFIGLLKKYRDDQNRLEELAKSLMK